jgi:hypothetical protein
MLTLIRNADWSQLEVTWMTHEANGPFANQWGALVDWIFLNAGAFFHMGGGRATSSSKAF